MAKQFRVRARLEAEDRASQTVAKVQSRFARLGSFLSSRFTVTLGDVTGDRVVRDAAGNVIGRG